MTYGTIKVDTVTFTDAGIDKSVTLSGLVQNPTFSGNVTVTGTLSGVTVTGTTANFTSGNFTNISGGTHTITSGVFAAGSAASPSITFTGDLNTGIYSPGADQVAISTGGSDRLFVDASGNVGINTSSPSNILQIEANTNGSQGIFARNNNTGSSASSYIGLNTSSASFTFRAHSALHSVWPATALINADSGFTNGIAFNTGTTAPIAFFTNNNERLRITSAGLVGIGTSSPASLLSVVKAAEGTSLEALRLVNESPNQRNTSSVYIGMYGSNEAYERARILCGNPTDFDGNNGFLSFWTRGSNTLSERLRITSAGFVGVGTSSPQSAVDVLSGVRGVPETSGSTTSVTTLRLRGSSNGVLDIGELSSATAGSYWLQVRDRTDLGYSYNLALQPNGGNVGIGTTSPADAQLYVNSSAIYGVRINHATLPLQGFLVNGTQAFTIGANSGGGGSFYYGTGNIEAARIDSSGRLLVGTSSARSGDGVTPRVFLEGAQSIQAFGVCCNESSTPGAGAYVFLSRSRGSAVGGSTIVSNGDTLGGINFYGADGTDTETAAAYIQCFVDGTPGANDMPGRLVFSTTADGASSPTERMRIDSSGRVGIGTTSPGYVLDVSGSARVKTGATGTPFIVATGGDSQGTIRFGSTSFEYSINGGADYLGLIFNTGGTERARIDSSGRLLVGTSSSSAEAKFIVQGGATAAGGAINIQRNATTASAGSTIGFINFTNSANNVGATISADGDGTWSAGTSHPTRLVFSTTADGASSPTERMRISQDGTVGIYNSSYLQPAVDNAVYLGGGTNLRWVAVYAANGTIQTSDLRQKTDIANSSLGAEFIKSLRPVSYKFTVGGNKPTGETDEDGNWLYAPTPGKRTHWGFVAQEVKQAIDDAGVDFGGWILDDPNDPDSDQGLRYDQFIAPLTKALQEALAEIDVLKAKVAALESA